MSPTAVVALDIGSSSGRAVLAELSGERLSLCEVARFEHRVRRRDGSLTWDERAITAGIRAGIAAARRCCNGSIAAVGIDTWGVDYALLDADNRPVLPLRAYRDGRMSRVRERFYGERISRSELWRLTGVQPADINTSLQVFADLDHDPTLIQRVRRLLMLPDYLGFVLTGEAAYGQAICSTTGLCEAGAEAWSDPVVKAVGMPTAWVQAPTADRALLGTVADCGVPVIRPGGHDTACAVHALSGRGEVGGAFISCGSWTLVGAETAAPVRGDEAFSAGFTNEARTDGGNRLLKNITGLWLLQECQRHWAQQGADADIETLKQEAVSSTSLGVVVDVNAEQFVLPQDMPAAIGQRCHELYGVEPRSRGQLVRLIFESLAVEHARSIDRVDAVTATYHPTVNLIGGGARNEILAQMTASACSRPVVAGPFEASATGNALAQFETLGVLDTEARERIVRASIDQHRYEPLDNAPFQHLRERLAEALTPQLSTRT
jgi:rhamnulokinase